jgi:hypothetical protein
MIEGIIEQPLKMRFNHNNNEKSKKQVDIYNFRLNISNIPSF